MSEHSAIEWCDATWNPVRGCTKVSPGCAHCYAETFAERFRGVKGHAYEQGFDPRTAPDKLDEPLRWKKPRRVFVNSMSDLFHEEFSFEYIAQVFSVMALADQHIFQVLTKRPERAREFFKLAYSFWPEIVPEIAGLDPSANVFHHHVIDPVPPAWQRRMAQIEDTNAELLPLPNVWLGVSVETQRWADERIPILLEIPAAIRFVSYEPALGSVDFATHLGIAPNHDDLSGLLHWIIVGGESGPKARPFDVQWARDTIRQCRRAGVACFVKQLGSKPVEQDRDFLWQEWRKLGASTSEFRGQLSIHLTDRKGGDPAEWPDDLRVRELPEAPKWQE